MSWKTCNSFFINVIPTPQISPKMKTKEELLAMIDRIDYVGLFEELDKYDLGEVYARLKKEFVLKGAVADIDFSDRMKVMINSINTPIHSENTKQIKPMTIPQIIQNTYEVLSSFWKAGGKEVTVATLGAGGGEIVKDIYNQVKGVFSKEKVGQLVLKGVEQNPDNTDFQAEFNEYLQTALESDETLKAVFEKLIEKYVQKENKEAVQQTINTLSITGNNNQTFQNVQNSTIITQTHSGTGDNVGGSKITK